MPGALVLPALPWSCSHGTASRSEPDSARDSVFTRCPSVARWPAEAARRSGCHDAAGARVSRYAFEQTPRRTAVRRRNYSARTWCCVHDSPKSGWRMRWPEKSRSTSCPAPDSTRFPRRLKSRCGKILPLRRQRVSAPAGRIGSQRLLPLRLIAAIRVGLIYGSPYRGDNDFKPRVHLASSADKKCRRGR